MSCMSVGCSMYSTSAGCRRRRIPDGGPGRPSLVRVDAQLRPAADGLTHAKGDLDVALLVAADLEVDRVEASLQRLPAPVGASRRDRRHRGQVHRSERRAERAAHQRRDGLAVVLAGGVPARHAIPPRTSAAVRWKAYQPFEKILAAIRSGMSALSPVAKAAIWSKIARIACSSGPMQMFTLADADNAAVGVEPHEPDGVRVSPAPGPHLRLNHGEIQKRQFKMFDAHVHPLSVVDGRSVLQPRRSCSVTGRTAWNPAVGSPLPHRGMTTRVLLAASAWATASSAARMVQISRMSSIPKAAATRRPLTREASRCVFNIPVVASRGSQARSKRFSG